MKTIPGFEDYAITSCGKVWSYKRKIFLAQRPDKDGYMRVDLYKDKKPYTRFVHQLIALAYIPNPENKPTVNHLDEVITHNWLNNLAWATQAEQNSYGNHAEKVAQKLRKPVRCIETGEVFQSIAEATQKMGLASGVVSRHANGLVKKPRFEFVKEC